MTDSTLPIRARRLVLALAAALACACGGGPAAPPPPPPPPTLAVTCPADVTVQSADGSPVFVSFDPPRTTGGLAPVSATCTPVPGPFDVGATEVTCRATDAGSQTSSCRFVVTVQPPPRLRFTRILAFGDSLTEGVVSFGPTVRVLLPNESYPAVLQRRLAARYLLQTPEVRNAGVGGEGAAGGGIARFRPVLLANRPGVVLIMEGTNDILDLEPGADRALAALRGMIREAKSQGVAVGLATVPPQRPGGRRDRVARFIPTFNERIRALAADEGVVLIDVFDRMKDDLSLIGVDDLHPTIRGYEVMADVFFEAIRQNFEETPQSAAQGGR